MHTKHLKIIFCALATLGVAALGLGAVPTREPLAGPAFGPRARPTPEQAVKYAHTVVLVRRVIQDNLVHSYVKEVWRSRAEAPPPAVGSEYGRPTPCDPQMRFPERDAIVFDFGLDPAKGLAHSMRIPVNEMRRVPTFLEEVPVLNDDGLVTRMKEEPMHVDDVRSMIKRTKPEKPGPAPAPTSPSGRGSP